MCSRIRPVSAETTAVDTAGDQVGLDPGCCRVDRDIDRAVHRDEVVLPDELVELDVVDVPTGPGLRRVQHDEHVVGVDVHLGHGGAPDAVLDGLGVEAEDSAEHRHRVRITLGDVHPQHAVLAGHQGGEVGQLVPADATGGDQPD